MALFIICNTKTNASKFDSSLISRPFDAVQRHFQDSDYVGYTRRHLRQGIEEHSLFTNCKHIKSAHGLTDVPDLTNQFTRPF